VRGQRGCAGGRGDGIAYRCSCVTKSGKH
jgi:hypothetical protein